VWRVLFFGVVDLGTGVDFFYGAFFGAGGFGEGFSVGGCGCFWRGVFRGGRVWTRANSLIEFSIESNKLL
jgi:hypothetical protein